MIGVLLLFAFSMFRSSAAELIEPTALELLRHLSQLFILAGEGIMVSVPAMRGEALTVIARLVAITMLGIAGTELVTRALLRRQRGHKNAGEREMNTHLPLAKLDAIWVYIGLLMSTSTLRRRCESRSAQSIMAMAAFAQTSTSTKANWWPAKVTLTSKS